MTTPTNWPNPERPSVPLFPERDGWHVLQTYSSLGLFYWDSENRYWWDRNRRYYRTISEISVDAIETKYISICLTPTQIAEMLAGERERCAKTCEAEQIPDFSMPEQWYNNGCKHSARAIRNLGAAP